VNTIVTHFIDNQTYQQSRLLVKDDINKSIYANYLQLQNSEFEKQSHFFHGRYENIYINEQLIPELKQVLEKIKAHIGNLIQQEPDQFKFGFWLNAMEPGHVTTRHNHDDDDESISGVYYIHVPENSGKLRLFSDKTVEISPEEGCMVLFSPRLDHDVSINNSKELRLSIGFNAG